MSEIAGGQPLLPFPLRYADTDVAKTELERAAKAKADAEKGARKIAAEKSEPKSDAAEQSVIEIDAAAPNTELPGTNGAAAAESGESQAPVDDVAAAAAADATAAPPGTGESDDDVISACGVEALIRSNGAEDSAASAAQGDGAPAVPASDEASTESNPQGGGAAAPIGRALWPELLADPLEADAPYQLPYDIWWEHKHGVLARKVDEADFTKVRSLVGLEARASDVDVPDVCSCDRATGHCGEDCVNRMMFIECWPNHCPCRGKCTNQRFQKRSTYGNSLARFHTEHKGVGLKAKQPIPRNSLVLEYVGEVMTTEAYGDKVRTTYANRQHFHCINLDAGLVIDGGEHGGEARFINHSCDPNCHIEKWNVLGNWRIGIIASRHILPGEELSYDYNFNSFGADKKCYCGSKKCRGWMGKRDKAEKVEKAVPKAKRGRKRKPKKPLGQVLLEEMQKGLLGPRTVKVARQRNVFLVRNVAQAQRAVLGDPPEGEPEEQQPEEQQPEGQQPEGQQPEDLLSREGILSGAAFDVFKAKLHSLQNGGGGRRTRTLAVADADEELDQRAQLASYLLRIHADLLKLKDAVSGRTLSKPFQKLPSKKQHPQYYAVVKNPAELLTVQEELGLGKYTSLKQYLRETNRVFNNATRYNKKGSELWTDANSLKVFLRKRVAQDKAAIEAIYVSDEPLEEEPASMLDQNVIRCVCRRYVDEGEMVQCENERCGVWQHVACVGRQVVLQAEKYLCERCGDREVSLEIPLESDSKKQEGVDVVAAEAQLAATKKLLDKLRPLAVQIDHSLVSVGKTLQISREQLELCMEKLQAARRRFEKANALTLKWHARCFDEASALPLCFEEHRRNMRKKLASGEEPSEENHAVDATPGDTPGSADAPGDAAPSAGEPEVVADAEAMEPSVADNSATGGRLASCSYSPTHAVYGAMQRRQLETMAAFEAGAVAACARRPEPGTAASVDKGGEASPAQEWGSVAAAVDGVNMMPVDQGVTACMPEVAAMGAVVEVSERNYSSTGALYGAAQRKRSTDAASPDGMTAPTADAVGDGSDWDEWEEEVEIASPAATAASVSAMPDPTARAPPAHTSVHLAHGSTAFASVALAVAAPAPAQRPRSPTELPRLSLLHQLDLVPAAREIRQHEAKHHALKQTEKDTAAYLKSLESTRRKVFTQMVPAEKKLATARDDIDLVQCVFYQTLVFGEVQYRLGDSVYVGKDKTKRQTAKDRLKARIVRIEKLWRDASGQPRASGQVYLRPKQTKLKTKHEFRSNELIEQAFAEEFRLDQVLGVCFVMRAAAYERGRPIECTNEADAFVVAMRTSVDNELRPVTKSDAWPTPMHPSVFAAFPEPRASAPSAATKSQNEGLSSPGGASRAERKKRKPSSADTRAGALRKRKASSSAADEGIGVSSDAHDADQSAQSDATVARKRLRRGFGVVVEDLLTKIPSRIESKSGRRMKTTSGEHVGFAQPVDLTRLLKSTKRGRLHSPARQPKPLP